MADLLQNVVINFKTGDTTDLKAGTDALRDLGSTQAKNVDEFKRANAELMKQAAVIDSVGTAGVDLKSVLEQINKSVGGMGAAFRKELQAGAAQALKDAGVSAEDFEAALNKVTAAQGNVSKATQPLKAQLLQVAQQMAALRDAGQGTGAQYDALQKKAASLSTALMKLGVAEGEVAAISNALTPTTDNLQTSFVSLNKELANVTKQLGKLKAAGQENTQAYQNLINKAAELKKAMSDVKEEISAVASNTSSLDGLISTATGVTSAFSIAQGAIGLFGENTEDLQRSLVKVNSAMAILQGLQQIQNILQKESAASILLNSIALKVQTGAQVAYNVVVGTSTGLLKAFRIALAATGIGLFILAIYALVQALDKEEESLSAANELIEQQNELLEDGLAFMQKRVDLLVAQANAEHKLASEISAIVGKSLLAERERIIDLNKLFAEHRDKLNATSAAYQAYNKTIEENNQKIRDIDQNLILTNLDRQKQLIDEALRGVAATIAARLAAAQKNSAAEFNLRKQQVEAEKNLALNADNLVAGERLKIIAEANAKIRAINLEQAKLFQQDRISAIEASLSKEQSARLAVGEKINQEEIDQQKKLVQERADLELLSEGLTQNQILAIKAKALAEQVQLQKEFNKQLETDALTDLVSRNTAELSQVNISEQKKLALQIENILAVAAAEVIAAEGNSSKIKEINAKRDADIVAARLASMQAATEYDVSLFEATNGEFTRALQKLLDDQAAIRNAATKEDKKRIEAQLGVQQTSIASQIKTIDLQTSYENAAIRKRIDALNEERRLGLVSEEDYKLQYAQLQDESAQIYEDAEKKKTALLKEEGDRRRAATRKEVEDIVAVTTEAVNTLAAIYALQSADEKNRIDAQKKSLDDAVAAGAITEREAKNRSKRLEAEEKEAQYRQAQRDKQIAVFNALLAIPGAFLKGLTQGGLPLAIVYGAFAAAQVALVASRKVPKLFTGKKDKRQGVFELGESGDEMYSQGNQWYVAKKSTIVTLGPDDQVFTPAETRRYLDRQIPSVDNRVMHAVVNTGNSKVDIDYERIGKEVGKHVQTDVYVDGVHAAQKTKEAFEKYLHQRRNFS